MAAKVILKVVDGPLKGEVAEFGEKAACVVVRGKEDIPLLYWDDNTASRHHCFIEVDPPAITIRDCGSKNGTWVNRTCIGKRPAGVSPEEARDMTFLTRELEDGDAIRIGKSKIVVEIHKAPAAGAREGARCQKCGARISPKDGMDTDGELLCNSCRSDESELVDFLLSQAKSRRNEFAPIAGYTRIRLLGRGGFGAVFLARHDESGDLVALKLMLPQVAVQERARKRFLREMRIAKRLDHPNVVRLLDSGSAHGTFFMTLEYCRGGTVADLMKSRGGTLPPDEAVGVILQALAGLEYAHSLEYEALQEDGTKRRVRGIVHRDISPNNIFLAGIGNFTTPKLADYGLAKAFDNSGLSGMTATGTVIGKPYFMPQQQVINFKYAKPDVDVWAMAATLYAMITGLPPRDFPSGADAFYQILETKPVPIRNRAPSVPRPLADVIDGALVDDPKIGIATALELRRALEKAMQ